MAEDAYKGLDLIQEGRQNVAFFMSNHKVSKLRTLYSQTVQSVQFNKNECYTFFAWELTNKVVILGWLS